MLINKTINYLMTITRKFGVHSVFILNMLIISFLALMGSCGQQFDEERPAGHMEKADSDEGRIRSGFNHRDVLPPYVHGPPCLVSI